MRKCFFPLVLLAALAGCAQFEPVPEGYAGPTALIKDSFRVISDAKAEFFYVSEVDKHPIRNSRSATAAANRGNGLSMVYPVFVSRRVPASEQSLMIVARTEYGAPIMTFTNEVFEASGVIKVKPEAGKTYVVKGVLGEGKSEVWVEDAESGQVLGEKVKAVGSSRLNLLQK